MMRFIWLFMLTIGIAHANTGVQPTIPKPLQEWNAWVLQDSPTYQCPFFYNQHQKKYCAWPSQLNLSLKKRKGHFSSYWQVYNDSYISLPGNSIFWPQSVSVNGKPAVVIKHNHSPAIKLPAGKYHIQGDFFWNKIPDSLAIPKHTGLISVKVRGKNIPLPTIKNNQLWLKTRDTGNNTPALTSDRLDLQVFRKITDNNPLQLDTQLVLQISGKQREITLPHALLQDFIPININSQLPAKLEQDGSLLVQVRPGRWIIELKARHPKLVTDISFNVHTPAWPKSEVWSFVAQTEQRLIEVTQLTAVDPSQTNMPNQWKQFPAYQVKQGETMHFNIIRRGDPEPEPNNLLLKRHLWLDFSGNGYTIQDEISGQITHGWRLDTLAETQLGHVSVNGQTQLITRLQGSDTQGIELRKGQLNLTADSRLTQSISQFSVAGWQEKFNSVKAYIHLPPGWHLLAVSGVDNVPKSWLTRWTLLDIFLVLIAALAVGRLWNNYWAFFALITLALIWHEPGAPRFIWLNILGATSLIKVLPQGIFLKFINFYRSSAWLVLLIITIPFLIQQVRIGLYPQLEKPWQSMTKRAAVNKKPSVAMDSLAVEEKVAPAAYLQKRSRQAVSLGSPSVSTNFKRIDPNANLQTGPGLPQWRWTVIPLSWNGSVLSQQQIKLWYLTPTTSLLLNFLRVGLVVILSLLMLNLMNTRFKFTIPRSLFSIGLVFIMLLPTTPVHADYPSPEILQQLKQHLLKAPDCLPSCAQISSLHIAINDKILQLDLQVHSQEKVAIPLPAKQKNWLPNEITVNKAITHGVIRDRKGLLWLSLPKGIHHISLKGIAPTQSSFSLPLPLKPRHITHSIKHWSLEGIKANGSAESNLHFTRIATKQESKSKLPLLSTHSLPPFIQVERTLQLGLDWHVSTRVTRLSNEPTAVNLKIPLLQGELITSGHIQSKNAQALIHMSANQRSVQWQSLLEKSAQLNLLAPNTEQWSEVWRAEISPIWHLQSAGISVVHHQNSTGQWLPEWRPWPNESIQLNISRPKAILGQTLTIDKSSLFLTSGKRSQELRLELDIRSSKGTQHILELPTDAVLQSVSINGSTQPIRQQGGTVTLPIRPGKQNIQLNWHTATQQSSILSTPDLSLGIPSVNSHLHLLLGQDRWVLLTFGPQLGPAVLFWGLAFVLVILSFALGRSPLTPLKNWHWFLLLIGLSQLPIAAALFVVAWLIILGVRNQQKNDNVNLFNLVQILIVLMTLSSLGILFVAVEQGLLGSPDMQIIGNQSSAEHLKWYQDRSDSSLPTATVISIPLISYRIMMLAWSLWLAVSLLNWLKWGWQCFSVNGLWKKSVPKENPETPTNKPKS